MLGQERQTDQQQELSLQHQKYITVLKEILPKLGDDKERIVYAQVLLALKIDGIVGEELDERGTNIVNTITASILNSEEKLEDALAVAERLVND